MMAQEWLRAAVATAPLNDNVDAAVKDQFLKANVNVEHNRGRFQVPSCPHWSSCA
jgi:hypothetical protein